MKAQRKPSECPFVIVEWTDAEAGVGWKPLDDKENAALPNVLSAGWMIGESKSHLTLAGDVSPTDQEINRTIKIPRGMVQRVVRIRKK